MRTMLVAGLMAAMLASCTAPLGPFTDARGTALIKNSDTPDGPHW